MHSCIWISHALERCVLPTLVLCYPPRGLSHAAAAKTGAEHDATRRNHHVSIRRWEMMLAHVSSESSNASMRSPSFLPSASLSCLTSFVNAECCSVMIFCKASIPPPTVTVVFLCSEVMLAMSLAFASTDSPATLVAQAAHACKSSGVQFMCS